MDSQLGPTPNTNGMWLKIIITHAAMWFRSATYERHTHTRKHAHKHTSTHARTKCHIHTHTHKQVYGMCKARFTLINGCTIDPPVTSQETRLTTRRHRRHICLHLPLIEADQSQCHWGVTVKSIQFVCQQSAFTCKCNSPDAVNKQSDYPRAVYIGIGLQ